MEHKICNQTGKISGCKIIFFEHVLNALLEKPFANIDYAALLERVLHKLPMFTVRKFVEYIYYFL